MFRDPFCYPTTLPNNPPRRPEEAHAQDGAAPGGEAQGGHGHGLMFLRNQQFQGLANHSDGRGKLDQNGVGEGVGSFLEKVIDCLKCLFGTWDVF